MITSKAILIPLISNAIAAYKENGVDALAKNIHHHILKEKVRFPLLEHAGKELYKALPGKDLFSFTDAIIALNEIGSYVFAGIMLQQQMDNSKKDFAEVVDKAVEYIITGDKWYVCDIIGERVQGNMLLHHNTNEQAMKVLTAHTAYPDKWIVRSVGVAVHYAVKNGLKKADADAAFRILLSCAGVTDFHTKKGIGWAAKTIAKFHPDIIERYEDEIMGANIRPWFKTKVRIGLGRASKYAGRYTG